jgi:hypothetical protein
MGTNTLAISTPSAQMMASVTCNGACSDLGPTDPLYKNQLGPRKKREQVREQIKDYVLHMLGAPVNKIELDEQNLDFCVDQSLKIIEDYAPREYFNYYTFVATPGKSVYEMPPEVGIIRNVYYKKHGNFAFQASDLDGAIPIEYFYPGGSYASIQGGLIDPIQPIWGRAGEWTLYKMYEQTYSRISSNIGGWEFIGDMRSVKLYPTPYAAQRVIVQYLQKMKDWGEVTQSMQEGALIYAKEILGRIRSKYATAPGPGGGIQLDGQALLQESREDKKEWMENLLYKWGEPMGPSLD